MLLFPAYLFVLLQIVTTTESIFLTHYVAPNSPPFTICPGFPCFTLDQYFRQPSYFSSWSTFIFLAGNHSTTGTLSLSGLSDVTFRGVKGATIVSFNAISLQHVNNFNIRNITFIKHPLLLSTALALKIINSRNVAIENSTFQRSRVQFNQSSVTIRSCQFADNFGNNGGAIEGARGSLDLISTVFSKNAVEFSGGAVSLSYSVLTLQENIFSFNEATKSGGALYCNNCSIVIRSSNVHSLSNASIVSYEEFSGNSAKDGGAIYVSKSIVEVSFSNLSCASNWAQYGGATYFHDSTLVVNSSIIFTNNSANSGGALYLSNSSMKINGHSTFSFNTAFGTGGAISLNHAHLSYSGSSLFINNSAESGGALYSAVSIVMFTGTSPILFKQNTAEFGGGLYGSFSELTLGYQVVIMGNVAQQYGGGIYFGDVFSPQVLSIQGKLVENLGLKCGGGVALQDSRALLTNVVFTNNSVSAVCAMQSNATFRDVTISSNTGEFGGGISASYSSLSFANNIMFNENRASVGGAIYSQYGALSFHGVMNFSQNIAALNGGALMAIGTSIHLQNVAYFSANSAERGGAMFFTNGAHLQTIFQESATLMTSYNYAARYGGAIYYDDEYITPVQCNFEYDQSEISNLPQCFFKFQVRSYNLVPEFITLASYNDTSGIDGDFLYGGCVDRCQIPVILSIYYTPNLFNNKFVLFYDVLQKNSSNIIGLGSKKAISSLPYTLCFCTNDNKYNCSDETIQVYRGESFNISLVTLNQMKTFTTSFVTTIINSTARLVSQSSQLVTTKCSNLTYALYSKEDYEIITLYADGPCRDTGMAKAVLRVALRSCPDIFVLYEDKCICEKRLQEYGANCTLESGIQLTNRAGSILWIKAWYDVKGSYLGVILCTECPKEYCKTGTVTIPLDQMNVQCAHNRSGILCGSCAAGYSLMLGSSRCEQCSNVFLLLILIFAFAGIALVTFLSLLKLTVATGLINSLILYANIVQINKDIFLPSGYTANALTVFVAWLNLDFGFKVCFFDGMDGYTQTWLQFAFPLYLWILISLIIIISRYSMTVSKLIGHNPISVLATLLLMSYAKILQNIIVVYSAVPLDYPNNETVRAWLKDANVPFLRSRHLLLSIVTSLILVFVFLPYTVFLLLGYKLYRLSGRKYLRWINKIKPFLDSYYAPYTSSTRYWTGFLLLIRCALYIVFSVAGTNKILLSINVAFTTLLIIAWLSGKIYKDRIVNVTEASIYLNLVILSMSSVSGTNSPALVYTLVGIVFTTMAAIILYHFYLLQFLSKSALWRMACNKMHYLVKALYRAFSTQENVQSDIAPGISSRDPHRIVTKSVVELREPLLEQSL